MPARLARPLLILVALAAATPALAAEVNADHPWSRATPPGAASAAVYLGLTSTDGDTLTGVSTPAAATASVHEMTMDGQVMRMREVQGGLALPPGRRVTLEPGGYHIMLTGLKAPLKRGGTVQLHLTFAKSPPLDVTAPVEGIGASGPGKGAGAPSHAMPGMKMN